MRKIVASIVSGLLLSVGAVAVTPAPVAQAAQVRVPKAKPGQFCAKSYHDDWTKTSKYGVLKCKQYASGAWHWKR